MSTRFQAQKSKPSDERIPPLQNGDRLTCDEFLRRYEAMPATIKAELIEGIVYMAPMPVSADDHGEPHFHLITWLGLYQAYTPGTQGGDNSTLRLDLKNVPQPDAFLRVLPSFGGQSRTVNGYIEGAPELTAEVAASSENYDLHDKLHAYRRNGVREYVVWRVRDRAIDWLILRGEQYDRLTAGGDGIVRSEVFPGLWLDPVALMERNLARVFDVVQQGLSSNEHAEFLERLRSARR